MSGSVRPSSSDRPSGPFARVPLSAWPHHDGSELHVGELFPALRDRVPVRLRIPRALSAALGPLEGVWLRSLRDFEPHYDAAAATAGDAAASSWDWYEADLLLVNPVQRYRWLVRAGGRAYWLNAAGFWDRDVGDAHDFRLTAHDGRQTPDWAHRAVMYQVFPDRFARSEQADRHPVPEWAIACDWDTTEVIGQGPQTPYQFFGGDLPGITERLDHLVGLGATVLYLTPLFPARSNHRYDASSFCGIDPLLGGDEALVELVRAAHARGLRVIGDLTTNHSGAAHEWFRAARADPRSPEADFYYFSADHSTYEAWLGVDSLPKLNWRSEGLRRRFVLDDDAMVARWLQPPFDLDGWRIDVGNMTGRLGRDDLNHEVAALLRDRVGEVKPDALLLAESTSDAAADFQGDTWQGAMTYTNFTRPLWHWLADAPEALAGREPWFFGVPPGATDQTPAETFLVTHLDFVSGFPWTVRRCNLNALDTHDTARAAEILLPGGQSVGVLLQYTMPGIPMVFMGDEFGLTGWNGEASRTPMPWRELECPEGERRRIREDLRGLYGALGSLRAGSPALLDGGIRWLHAEGDVLVFIREHAEQSALVVAARAAFQIELPPAAVGTAARGVWEHALDVGPGVWALRDGDAVVLEGAGGPCGAVWLLPGVRRPHAA
ncbi:glycoside hydrolase family 13 protein [Zhihengliuella sp.]|uniref:glycoside hydrolase family 13 protein n=1 Tax=Zhihengliuella sp. TaxID=1954483 RepID=UPI002810D4C3|nr:glycoside hydrolase family 13 protein [Zhihengliuella sp.]